MQYLGIKTHREHINKITAISAATYSVQLYSIYLIRTYSHQC